MEKISYSKAKPLFFLLIFIFSSCGAGKFSGKSPYIKEQIIQELYPYNFSNEKIPAISKLKQILLSGKYPGKKGDIYLFAYGKTLIDLFLFTTLCEGETKQSKTYAGECKISLKHLSDLLDLANAETFDEILKNRQLLKEPFYALRQKYPSSPYANAFFEADSIISIIASIYSSEKNNRFKLPDFTGVSRQKSKNKIIYSLKNQLELALLIKALDTFEKAYFANPHQTTQIIMSNLLPIVYPDKFFPDINEEILKGKNFSNVIFDSTETGNIKVPENSDPITYVLKQIFSWVENITATVLNGREPIYIEAKPFLKAKLKNLESMIFNSSPLLSMHLPKLDNFCIWTEKYYPYSFIKIEHNGRISIQEEPILRPGTGKNLKILNEKSEFLGPGKIEAEDGQLLNNMQGETIAKDYELTLEEIKNIVPPQKFTAQVTGKPVAVAIEKNTPIFKIVSLIPFLRKRFDRILQTTISDGGIHFIPAMISPDCQSEGIIVTISLEENLVRITKFNNGEKDERVIKLSPDKEHIKPEVIAVSLTSFIDLSQSSISIELAFKSGNWTWDDLLKIQSEILKTAWKNELPQDFHFYLLPEIPFEKKINERKLNPEIFSSHKIEEFILKGVSGNFNENELDSMLNTYLSGLDPTEAAMTILNVGRCWRGTFKERAEDAFSKGNQKILGWIADFLGDSLTGNIATNALIKAGKISLEVTAPKFISNNEKIFTDAWNVFSAIGFEDSKYQIEIFLKSPDSETKIRALKLLSQIGPAGGIPEIVELMDDPDEMVQRWAIACSGMLGMTNVKNKLVQILRSKGRSSFLLSDAIFSLGLLEATDIKEEIIAFANHSEPAVRSAVALAIGNMRQHDETSKETLIMLLYDSDRGVKINAIKAAGSYADTGMKIILESMKVENDPEINQAIEETLFVLNNIADSQTEKEKLKNLIPFDASLCHQLEAEQILKLSEIEGKEAFNCLVKLTLSKDPEIKKAAVESLGKRGDKNAISHLKKRTKDKIPDVRKAAWKALKELEKK